MIGSDLKFESAESRPIIESWLTKGILMISFLILFASCLSLFASIRQLSQVHTIAAIKPGGENYDAKTFYTSLEAAQYSLQYGRRSTGSQKEDSKKYKQINQNN